MTLVALNPDVKFMVLRQVRVRLRCLERKSLTVDWCSQLSYGGPQSLSLGRLSKGPLIQKLSGTSDQSIPGRTAETHPVRLGDPTTVREVPYLRVSLCETKDTRKTLPIVDVLLRLHCNTNNEEVVLG